MVIFYFTRTNKFMRLKIYYIYHTPIYCIVLKHIYGLNACTELCTILLDGCKCLQVNTKRLSIV